MYLVLGILGIARVYDDVYNSMEEKRKQVLWSEDARWTASSSMVQYETP